MQCTDHRRSQAWAAAQVSPIIAPVSTNYGTVQAQVYTRPRVNHRALACRGVRASRVLGKGLTREYQTYLFC